VKLQAPPKPVNGGENRENNPHPMIGTADFGRSS